MSLSVLLEAPVRTVEAPRLPTEPQPLLDQDEAAEHKYSNCRRFFHEEELKEKSDSPELPFLCDGHT